MREFIDRANKPQQRYWGVDLSDTALGASTLHSAEVTPPGWTGAYHAKVKWSLRQKESKAARYHATVRYRYPLPAELLTPVGKMRALGDMLGISQDPAIIWNAIPYSFVVDWFVNVGGYLNRMRVDNIHAQTEILDFCHSVKVEREWKLELQRWVMVPNGAWPSNSQYYISPYSAGGVKASIYVRRTGKPDMRTAIATSGLNAREFSLGGALSVARGGNHRSYR
jgi:hypothetical protein